MRWRHPYTIAGALAAVGIIAASTYWAIPTPLGPGCYRDVAIDVRSGNTLNVDGQTVWLLTHDAPNVRNYGCQAESEMALWVRDRLQTLIATRPHELCITAGNCPWGADCAYLVLQNTDGQWIDAGAWLGREGGVMPWTGQTADWCQDLDSPAVDRHHVAIPLQ